MNQQPTAEELLASFNRPMPWSEEAEKGVLSCLLQDPVRVISHLHSMPPGLFYHTGHREIFTTLVDEATVNRPIDPISLTHRLRSLGRLEHVGGAAALSELFAFVAIPSHFSYYLGILRELFSQRKHIEAHARSLDKLLGASHDAIASVLDDVKGLIEEAGRMPGQALKSLRLSDAIDPLLQAIEYRAAHPGRLPGITTGFATIDRNTGGMMPGQVWVFAGEPGDGKSTMMQNCAEAADLAGHRVRWYPLEMPQDEQSLRLLASHARVDNASLYCGKLTRAEMMALSASCGKIKAGSNIELVDVEDATATDIFADIEKCDAPIIVVDYLQLMEDGSARKSDTRENVLASISRRQKRLARRTGKTILTASQLNDSGKLRESRAIGQDADKVFMIKKHANDSELGHDDERRNLECAKNRGGKRGWTLPLRFLGSIFQFREESDEF